MYIHVVPFPVIQPREPQGSTFTFASLKKKERIPLLTSKISYTKNSEPPRQLW